MIKIYPDRIEKLEWMDGEMRVVDKYPGLVPYLNEKVELHDGITLGDVFKHIEAEQPEMWLCFRGALGQFDIQDFIDECKEDPVGPVDNVIGLEVYYVFDLWDNKEHGEVQLYPDFHGVDKDGGINWSMSFTRLSDMAHLPLSINKHVTLHIPGLDEPIETKATMSVYDFLFAILYDISFFGPPKCRDKKMEELDENYKDATEQLAKNPNAFTDISGLLEDDDTPDC